MGKRTNKTKKINRPIFGEQSIWPTAEPKGSFRAEVTLAAESPRCASHEGASARVCARACPIEDPSLTLDESKSQRREDADSRRLDVGAPRFFHGADLRAGPERL